MIPERIVIHHSGTLDGPELSWNAIRKYHVEHNGWTDIGYNCGVELLGTSYEVLWGRPWDLSGAHTLGWNGKSLGICFISDFNVTIPCEGQLLAGASIVKYWLRHFGLTKGSIYRHCDLNETDCPGKNFDLTHFKNLL